MDKNQNILIDHQTRIEPYKQKNTDQDSSLKETNIIYAVDQNRVSPQVVSSHTAKTNAIEMKNSNQSIIVEKTAKSINYYEIKQLAKKVYPLVMKQWQKEFERRGVFYG
jgi:Fe-S cluster assembly scaffold protein SufB